ncbi:hypothetical protein [Scytonema sp. NUACC26]|uniref:hypothetical protein n=1 Tax=Scytonema sp. NUACC26 TaxID=3140176 RepID=UPI0034DC8190
MNFPLDNSRNSDHTLQPQLPKLDPIASDATVGNPIAPKTHQKDTHHRKELFQKRLLDPRWCNVHCQSVESVKVSPRVEELLGAIAPGTSQAIVFRGGR